MNRKQVAANWNANADRHAQNAKNWRRVARVMQDRKVRAEARRRAKQEQHNSDMCRAAAQAQAW